METNKRLESMRTEFDTKFKQQKAVLEFLDRETRQNQFDLSTHIKSLSDDWRSAADDARVSEMNEVREKIFHLKENQTSLKRQIYQLDESNPFPKFRMLQVQIEQLRQAYACVQPDVMPHTQVVSDLLHSAPVGVEK